MKEMWCLMHLNFLRQGFAIRGLLVELVKNVFIYFHKEILTSFTAALPLRAVPVMMVPCPLMLKQWSTEKIKGPAVSRLGTYVLAFKVSIRSSRPTVSVS